jgi:hypothetical protein
MNAINILKKIVPLRLRKLRAKLLLHARLRGKLTRQLSFSGVESEIAPKPFAGKRVLVPIIETSHYQHQHLLALAKALQLRGAEVMVLVCGEVLDGCEIKSVRNEGDTDPCLSCRLHRKHTVPLYGLKTVTLADFISPSAPGQIREEATEQVMRGQSIQRHGIQLDQAVQDSVIRYYYGAVPANVPQVAKVRQNHSMSALLTAEVAYRIDQQWHPDIVLCNMSCYSAWEGFYKYYQVHGKRFRQVSLTQFNLNAVIFNQFELFGLGRRFSDYSKSRLQPVLSDDEKADLGQFMTARHAGNAPIFQSLGFFDSIQESAQKKLNVDSSKRNIFLFSNIYWDVGLSSQEGLYTDVVSWVTGTIDLLKDNANVHLYIKPHPGEVFDPSSSLKGVSQFIREKYPQLPNNITIIEPECKIKTYDLFPYIDLGVIFTGTLGLEMMLAEIPVVSTGATSHYGLGFAAEPNMVADYLALLLGEKEPPKYSRDDLELFAYFYFIRCSMPWTLTKQAYGDRFNGFAFNSLDDLLPGKDPLLDHLCDCVIDSSNTIPETWPT